jgi:hypothetical protein
MFEFGHTPYTYKQITELAIASLTTNIVSRANYMSIGSQNGPIFHEHASQGFHVVLNETQPPFVHLLTSIGGNYPPI